MSAMSASPVKPPVLPPTGVTVPPPVATSPPKVGLMPIPATLTIAPSKPTNMNHAAMPLSLIADHKIPPQFPIQTQPGVPSTTVQPISQPLPRTPEKPKELSPPVTVLPKPTSNGMESLTPPNLIPTPAVPEAQISAVPQKIEQTATTEASDKAESQTPSETVTEPPTIAAAPQSEPEIEKKEETAATKLSEPVNNGDTQLPPLPVATTTQETVSPAPTPTTASAPTPAPEQPPTVTPSVSRTEAPVPHSKPEIKVATIPRQATKRKRELKVPPVTPEIKKEGKDDDRKSKRVRLPTQPYQSPLPELNMIAKISKSTKSTPTKAADDKLIVFYKNEFLAVRNAEGGFYVCQAMQNIYKSSPRIRIRWLSQEEGKDTYSPDFYDHTDFDCILTNLNLDKVEKEKFRLPQVEQQRTESILKRALDVEKGVSEKPPVTEEHPDGLDLSLFRDESQLKKSSKSRSRNSSKKSNSAKSDGAESAPDDDDDDEDDDEEEDDEEEAEDEEEEKKAKKETAPKTSKRKKKTAKKKPPSPEKKATAKTTSSGNKSTVQTSKKKTEARGNSKRKSSVSSNLQPAEKRARKSDTSSQSSERTNKTRSAEAVVGTKSRRDRRAQSRK
ncbi:nucleolar and coiled-body phosphoprotein 1-like [Homalodisca vitripennis]|nr:nucleolar and coiled-body phosphoprotein 1-like [Homalodisca vitripennis]KAG8273332.1 hypothetical protein J6590_023844 [Homalodisca vitripennis]